MFSSFTLMAKNLFVGIKVKLLTLHRRLRKMLSLEEHFKRHLEAFASEPFISKQFLRAFLLWLLYFESFCGFLGDCYIVAYRPNSDRFVNIQFFVVLSPNI